MLIDFIADEAGKNEPTIEYVQKVHEVLGISFDSSLSEKLPNLLMGPDGTAFDTLCTHERCTMACKPVCKMSVVTLPPFCVHTVQDLHPLSWGGTPRRDLSHACTCRTIHVTQQATCARAAGRPALALVLDV